MPYYEYETIPKSSKDKPEKFEVRQCMDDAPLTEHPETGVPVKRVYSSFSVGATSSSNSNTDHGGSCNCCCGGGGSCQH